MQKYKVYYYNNKLNKTFKNIKFINKKYPIFTQLRSKYIFYSYRDDGFKSHRSARQQVIIDTTHGSPLKNIGYLRSNSKYKRLWKYDQTFDYIICSSDFFKEIIKEAFGSNDKQCLIIGLPRNDDIFQYTNLLKKFHINKDNFAKIILWMPTWRSNAKHDLKQESNKEFPILNLSNIKKLNNFLLEQDTLLVIKPHPFQTDLPIFNSELSNIRIIRNEDVKLFDGNFYQIFQEVDALLTDYSSV